VLVSNTAKKPNWFIIYARLTFKVSGNRIMDVATIPANEPMSVIIIAEILPADIELAAFFRRASPTVMPRIMAM